MAHRQTRYGGADSWSGAAITRRQFVHSGAGAGAGLLMWRFVGGRAWAQPTAGGVLDPALDPEVRDAARDPTRDAAQRPASRKEGQGGRLLPDRGPPVRASRSCRRAWVWARRGLELRLGRPPARRSTIRRSRSRRAWRRPVRVKWINELVKPNGEFRPHLLAGRPDASLGQPARRRPRPRWARQRPRAVPGPVPIVTHLHGGHSSQQSSTASPRPGTCPRRATSGRLREGGCALSPVQAQAQRALGQAWTPGGAVFQYDNDQRATAKRYATTPWA